MLKHKMYLNGSDENLKRAFLNGCKTIIAVLQHCKPEQLPALLIRTDENWIRYLCDNEQRRLDAEQLTVMKNTLQHFQPIDRQLFRGMLLNCYRINDAGQEVDDAGEICNHQPYPYQYYVDMCDDECPPRTISNEEYSQLPPDEQANYMRYCYMELKTKDGRSKHRFREGDRAFMTAVLQEILLSEPEAVHQLYSSALEEDDWNIIQSHRDVFEEILMPKMSTIAHDIFGKSYPVDEELNRLTDAILAMYTSDKYLPKSST